VHLPLVVGFEFGDGVLVSAVAPCFASDGCVQLGVAVTFGLCSYACRGDDSNDCRESLASACAWLGCNIWWSVHFESSLVLRRWIQP
jgi:hypothetical protein